MCYLCSALLSHVTTHLWFHFQGWKTHRQHRWREQKRRGFPETKRRVTTRLFEPAWCQSLNHVEFVCHFCFPTGAVETFNYVRKSNKIKVSH